MSRPLTPISDKTLAEIANPKGFRTTTPVISLVSRARSGRRRVGRERQFAMHDLTAHIIVAIDGPAASGKSSVAQELARRLGFVYVNSGAMYRAITWLVLERGIAANDTKAIEHLAETVPLICTLRDRDSTLLLDGVDPEPFLRQDRVNDNVSLREQRPRVREIVVKHLRVMPKQTIS